MPAVNGVFRYRAAKKNEYVTGTVCGPSGASRSRDRTVPKAGVWHESAEHGRLAFKTCGTCHGDGNDSCPECKGVLFHGIKGKHLLPVTSADPAVRAAVYAVRQRCNTQPRSRSFFASVFHEDDFRG